MEEELQELIKKRIDILENRERFAYGRAERQDIQDQIDFLEKFKDAMWGW